MKWVYVFQFESLSDRKHTLQKMNHVVILLVSQNLNFRDTKTKKKKPETTAKFSNLLFDEHTSHENF